MARMSNGKRIESAYSFQQCYTDEKGQEKMAIVYLAINYESGTFAIRPRGGNNFDFSHSSNKGGMWRAVIYAIKDAIDFATIEIEENCHNKKG